MHFAHDPREKQLKFRERQWLRTMRRWRRVVRDHDLHRLADAAERLAAILKQPEPRMSRWSVN
jgi:hypothetical protein